MRHFQCEQLWRVRKPSMKFVQTQGQKGKWMGRLNFPLRNLQKMRMSL